MEKISVIQRLKRTQDHLRIYLDFKEHKFFQSRAFYLVTFSIEQEKECIYSWHFSHKKGECYPVGHTVKAVFYGTVHGGEMEISLDQLSSFSKYYVKIEGAYTLFDESDWQEYGPLSLAPSLHTLALIPCYNVSRFGEQVIRATLPFATHLLLIDDGSTDDTAAIIGRVLSEAPEKITLLSFSKNRGKGAALLEGFRYALTYIPFDVLVTIDGDAQHRPSDIPDLVAKIQQGSDLVIGARLFDLMPLRSRFSNKFMALLLRCLYPQAPQDTQSGLRAFSRSLLKVLVQNIHHGRYETEFECLLIALSHHFKIKSLPIATLYLERNRTSHFLPIKDGLRIFGVWCIHLFKHRYI